MYGTCLFCSASLGTNEAIETFPVGERVAFDARHGRLWAACGRCGRWNLAPIEERWEAVEEAERMFRDTRTRVHSENIGLARLPDGTRLIRVGSALPGEIAAWRYGGQLISRRRRNLALTAAGLAGGTALLAGFPIIASAGVPIALVNAGLQFGSLAHARSQQLRVVHHLPAHESPSGRPLSIRRWHLHEAALGTDDTGSVVLDMPPIISDRPRTRFSSRQPPERTLRLSGAVAQRVIGRCIIDYNARGASRDDLASALRAIEEAGGADEYARAVAASGAAIVRVNAFSRRSPGTTYSPRQILGTFRGERLPIVKYRSPFYDTSRPQLSKTAALALEMALQDESERRALEGELAALEAAWREAEEIARIADALPHGV